MYTPQKRLLIVRMENLYARWNLRCLFWLHLSTLDRVHNKPSIFVNPLLLDLSCWSLKASDYCVSQRDGIGTLFCHSWKRWSQIFVEKSEAVQLPKANQKFLLFKLAVLMVMKTQLEQVLEIPSTLHHHYHMEKGWKWATRQPKLLRCHGNVASVAWPWEGDDAEGKQRVGGEEKLLQRTERKDRGRKIEGNVKKKVLYSPSRKFSTTLDPRGFGNCRWWYI